MILTAKNNAAEAPTIAEIAREVPVGAQLQMASVALNAMLKQREAIGAELTCAIAAARDPRQGGDRTKINSLMAEVAAVDAKMGPARDKVMELRLARSAKVAAALGPRRLAAARQLVRAIDDLGFAFNELRACCEEVRCAGDPDQDYFHPPVVGLVLDHAQKLIRLSK